MDPDVFTIATFNANSIRVRTAAVLAWLDKHKPDVLAIQETKVPDAGFPHAEFAAEGWHAVCHGQKSYNGVCLISRNESRREARDVARGLGDCADDPQARLIAASYPLLPGGAPVRIVNAYAPQGSEVGSDKFAYKLAWFERLRAYIERNHKPDEPLILLGDINIAPDDIDVYAPDFLAGEVGLHPDERAALARVTGWGLTDLFRKLHPGEAKCFSFFDYRVRDSVKYRKGWRIDHIYATAPLAARLDACDIDMEPRLLENASDHTFVWARFRA